MNEEYIKELAQVIVQINDEEFALDFLHNILTPHELEEISRRLQIAKLFIDGLNNKEIAERLNVSISTVERGANEVQHGAHGFLRIFINKDNNKKKKKWFLGWR